MDAFVVFSVLVAWVGANMVAVAIVVVLIASVVLAVYAHFVGKKAERQWAELEAEGEYVPEWEDPSAAS